MNLKLRVCLFIGLSILPYALTQFIKTESCTKYLWWENAIGFIVVVMLLVVWFEYWFNKLFKDYK